MRLNKEFISKIREVIHLKENTENKLQIYKNKNETTKIESKGTHTHKRYI